MLDNQSNPISKRPTSITAKGNETMPKPSLSTSETDLSKKNKRFAT